MRRVETAGMWAARWSRISWCASQLQTWMCNSSMLDSDNIVRNSVNAHCFRSTKLAKQLAWSSIANETPSP